jgi:hypothetical protein
MELFIMFAAVLMIVMLAGQSWRKRGRDSDSSGFFPWTGNDNSSDGSNHHHHHDSGGHHGHSDGGGHGGGDCGGGHGGH